MNVTEMATIYCPYCAESIEIIIDRSVENQQYIEDCQVCCRPIIIETSINNMGDLEIVCRDENEC